MDKSNILKIHTKTRKENNKLVKYFITNDSFEDDYGSYRGDYHAWRQEPKGEPVCLNPQCYYFSLNDALRCITFGNWVNCKTCGHRHFVEEKK